MILFIIILIFENIVCTAHWKRHGDLIIFQMNEDKYEISFHMERVWVIFRRKTSPNEDEVTFDQCAGTSSSPGLTNMSDTGSSMRMVSKPPFSRIKSKISKEKK